MLVSPLPGMSDGVLEAGVVDADGQRIDVVTVGHQRGEIGAAHVHFILYLYIPL